jgi:hypothetical protein
MLFSRISKNTSVLVVIAALQRAIPLIANEKLSGYAMFQYLNDRSSSSSLAVISSAARLPAGVGID